MARQAGGASTWEKGAIATAIGRVEPSARLDLRHAKTRDLLMSMILASAIGLGFACVGAVLYPSGGDR